MFYFRCIVKINQSMNKENTRKAVIIGSPGGGSTNFLYGVEKDLINMPKFLQADNGGRWEEDEIIIMENPTYSEVIAIIDSIDSEYVLVYFSGHGYTGSNGERFLELKDGSIQDIQLLSKSPKQLILVDACRNYVQPGIYGIPEYAEKWYSFDGYYEARELFDNAIINSPDGHIIIHATQMGEYSLDSSDGGHFTQALLNVATRMRSSSHKYSTFSIKRILDFVPQVLQKEGSHQVPEVVRSTGNLKVPFAIGIPKSIDNALKVDNSQKIKPQSTVGGLVILGLSILAVMALSGSNRK